MNLADLLPDPGLRALLMHLYARSGPAGALSVVQALLDGTLEDMGPATREELQMLRRELTTPEGQMTLEEAVHEQGRLW